MVTRERPYAPLSEEVQVEHYVSALKSASVRVRYVMLTLTVVSILIFVGYNNTRKSSWFDSRLEVARAAAELWGPDTTDLNSVLDGMVVTVNEVDKRTPENQTEPSSNEAEAPSTSYLMSFNTSIPRRVPNSGDSFGLSELEQKAIWWAETRNLTSRSSIEGVIRTLEEARTQNVTTMHMPILGVAFDINDLGLFSGISFVVLLTMLAYSFSRYHENLFLALWKVRRICKEENRPCDRGSEANLVYHSLAMAQLFSKPPSLARPKGGAGRSLSKIIVLLPVVIQSLILGHDMSTVRIGQALNGGSTSVSLAAQLLCFLIVVVFTLICLAYTRSSERRWKHTFIKINPCLENVPNVPWLEWVSLRKPSRDYEAEYWSRYQAMMSELSPGEPVAGNRHANDLSDTHGSQAEKENDS